MIGFLQLALGCAIVAALSLIHPDDARWFALAFLGVAFVATAIPRRVQAGAEDPAPPKEARGTFED